MPRSDRDLAEAIIRNIDKKRTHDRDHEKDYSKKFKLNTNSIVRTINKRINYLNDKLSTYIANGRDIPEMIIRERESLIWMQDKIYDLCKRLIMKDIELERLKDQLSGEVKLIDKDEILSDSFWDIT